MNPKPKNSRSERPKRSEWDLADTDRERMREVEEANCCEERDYWDEVESAEE